MPERPERRVESAHRRLRAWRAGPLLVDTRRAHLYIPSTQHRCWAVQP